MISAVCQRVRSGHSFPRTAVIRSQSGQALLLGLVLLGACLIALTCAWTMGLFVHDHYSLKRATDSAVYSAALVQARSLNFHAYLNRAQLAHLVAMKHLVVLASAEKFRATQSTRSKARNPPAALIGAFFGPQYGASYLAASGGGPTAAVGLQALKEAFQSHDETVIQYIEASRVEQIRHLATMRKNRFEAVLINNVGQSGSRMRGSSLKDLGLTVKTLRDDFGGRVRAISTKNKDWQSMLKQSFEPYGYLSERNFIARSYWAINLRCPHLQNELRRRGSVSYNANGAWQSNDTLSYHAVRYNKFIGCYHREYPMGWAFLRAEKIANPAADMQVQYPSDFSGQSFWRWVSSNGMTNWNIFSGSENYLADGWSYMESIRWKSAGSRHFGSMSGDLSVPITFGMEARQSSASLTANHPVKEIAAQSYAQTYYSRPNVRADRKNELPSLFQPYWQARLAKED